MGLGDEDLLAGSDCRAGNEFPIESPVGIYPAFAATCGVDCQSNARRRIKGVHNGLSIDAEAIFEQNAPSNPPRVLRIGNVLGAFYAAAAVEVQTVSDRSI